MSEKYDFSKFEDQQKLDQLPQKEKEGIIGAAQEEAVGIKKKAEELSGKTANIESGSYKRAEKIIERESVESLLNNFEIENYVKKINFGPVLELLKHEGDKYRQAVKEKGEDFAKQKHGNIYLDHSFDGIYYTFKYIRKYFDFKEHEISANDPIRARKDNLIKIYQETSLSDNGELGRLLWLEQVMPLLSNDDLEDMLKNNIVVGSIMKDFENSIKHRMERFEKIYDTRDNLDDWSIRREYRYIIDNLVFYRKAFNTKNDFLEGFIRDKIDKLINVLNICEMEERLESKSEGGPSFSDRFDRNILPYLLKLQFLNPNEDILDKKDLEYTESKVNEYIDYNQSYQLSDGLDLDHTDHRKKVYGCMNLLGLVDDIKKMRTKN